MKGARGESWFTVESIDAETFAISEYGHWEKVHSYLLIGRDRAALIDTGTGIGRIEAVAHSLTDRPVLVLTTHCHWDHIGGHGAFVDIAVHQDDRAWLEEGLPVSAEVVRRQVVKEAFTAKPPEDFDINSYVPPTCEVTRVLRDGDAIDLGGRKLRVLHTPGHSPGHVCFHEEARGYLATGDLLYDGILYANYPSTDPRAFALSIARVSRMANIKRLLPGHNNLDLPTGRAGETRKTFETIEARGELRHGTGLHRVGSVAVLL